jgi:hypothetical protein
MQNKRMFAHDYTRVGFYMITLVTAGRRALFGACRDNRAHLSPAGEVAQRRWQEIPAHRPAIETNTLAADVLAALKAEVAEQTAGGAVMVSPFFSPGEKAIAGLVMEQDFGNLILLKPDGFPPLYKPSGAYFDLCAKGRLLVLSPFAYTGRKQPLTRERCLQMNEWVKQLCANNAAP